MFNIKCNKIKTVTTCCIPVLNFRKINHNVIKIQLLIYAKVIKLMTCKRRTDIFEGGKLIPAVCDVELHVFKTSYET